MTVYRKMALRDPTTVGAYRRQIVENLFSGMLSARFAEIAQKPDAPFLDAVRGRGGFVRTKEASMLSAAVKEDGIERRARSALHRSRARRRVSASPRRSSTGEKRNTLRGYEQALTEKDTQKSAGARRRVLRNFTQREPIPGIAYE